MQSTNKVLTFNNFSYDNINMQVVMKKVDIHELSEEERKGAKKGKYLYKLYNVI